jgi:UDP-N-acetyl-D-mannosaminuronate dehydrogenase
MKAEFATVPTIGLGYVGMPTVVLDFYGPRGIWGQGSATAA